MRSRACPELSGYLPQPARRFKKRTASYVQCTTLVLAAAAVAAVLCPAGAAGSGPVWLLAPVPTASAAPLTVCPDGGSYTTIQQAVNAASGGDVIEICAGVYDESVDLSAMASPGALTLRGVGTVWISPTAGAALYAPTSFDGSLTLDAVSITAPQGDGLSIPQLKGDLTLFDVDVVAVGGMGITGLVEGSLTISNSSVLSSTTHGVLLVVAQQAHVYTSTFSGNGQDGLGSGLDIQPGGLVTCGADTAELDNVTAEENSGDGVAVRAVGRGDPIGVAEVVAHAYGHGLCPVSAFAVRHGADWVAVATVQEGIALQDLD